MSTTRDFLTPPRARVSTPLLGLIAAQAREADLTRSVSLEVIDAIKASDLIRLSATRTIGGVEATIGAIAGELEAIAAACASTAWCLWNHLCVFHFYVSLLGPAAAETLSGIVGGREWVTYPNGAGTSVKGRATAMAIG